MTHADSFGGTRRDRVHYNALANLPPQFGRADVPSPTTRAPPHLTRFIPTLPIITPLPTLDPVVTVDYSYGVHGLVADFV